MQTITPVILCGGSGTRLWPLSRKSYPKQFAAFLGGESLFQASARRLSGPVFAAPIVITQSDFRFIVAEQLTAVGIDPGTILLEPEGRNTAPAVLAAALWLADRAPEALMLVAPSDHVIPDAVGFRRAVVAGLDAARAGDIVAFGIRPDRAETGFGYLELTGPPHGAVAKVVRFVEKPDAGRADALLEAGNALWNAGLFLGQARVIVAAFEMHAPQLIAPVRAAVSAAREDLGFLRLDPRAWSDVEAISLDYAVMEQAANLAVVPFDGGWSDLGSWEAVWQESSPDESGVATSGAAEAIDCRDTLLRSEAEGLQIVGIGLDGIIAVAMPDAVLVADRRRTQDVKLAVEALRARGAVQAETFPKDHRPWGWFETLVLGERFQVKRIVVKPGGRLSLQSHVHRAEHWVVVAGTAKVSLDGRDMLITENQSVFIPLGAMHRLENPGRLPVILIEVQTGAYLGEDDITRFEDAYARGQGARG